MMPEREGVRCPPAFSFIPRQIKEEREPYSWALCEAGECPQYSAVSKDPTWPKVETLKFQYRTMLLLASGIQMAGPNLAAETFERALHSTAFPNPDHPNMAGEVGFGGRSYSMTIDAAEIFWSNTAVEPYGRDVGAWCYAEGGARRRSGSWPKGGDPFFVEPCDSGAS